MKKLTLIMLVAMVPFFTMGQKRSKKDKNETTQGSSKIAYQFMVITGHTMMNRGGAGNLNSTSDTRAAMENRIKITFDFGGLRTNDEEDLSSQQYKSMAHAVNAAARAGWEFAHANVERNNQGATVHYYYMEKRK
ncbi:MAG: hypothetical protein VX762_04105 [Bacteroidota bacterium]|nr:hypothetical protein [Bacteroidota bacterium]MEC9209589.1 hypothetical protein [Bacteroidota bacterium]